MPYRQSHLVRSWVLTARSRWRVVGWVGLLLAVGGPACLALSDYPLAEPLAYPLAALPGLLAFAIWAWAGDGYRVHGGRAEMRLFEERLEVPRARRVGVDVMPLAGLSMNFVTIRGSVNVLPVSETVVLHLESAQCRRQIAHHLVGSPQALERIAEDIARVQRGEPPTADPASIADHPAARDDPIDAELSKLD